MGRLGEPKAVVKLTPGEITVIHHTQMGGKWGHDRKTLRLRAKDNLIDVELELRHPEHLVVAINAAISWLDEDEAA